VYVSCDSDLAKLLQHSEYPDAPVYGGSDKIPALTRLVKDGDTFSVGESVKVK
jgi:hydroxyacylglutathione hydrolase